MSRDSTPPFTRYLMSTDEWDTTTVIGPFRSADRLERFLDKHGRVFRSFGNVYTPAEYDAMQRKIRGCNYCAEGTHAPGHPHMKSAKPTDPFVLANQFVRGR